jgi:ParB family chromosome partitioning protein
VVTPADAEEYTAALGQVLGGGWRQVALGERLGVPRALGLTTERWVRERLGGYARLTVDERREAARELTAAEEDGGHGMTQREAAEVLGVDQKTVSNDTRPAREENSSPPDDPRPAEPEIVPAREENSSPPAEPVPEPEEPAPAKGPHVARNTGESEWYTPPEYIAAALAVMGGIDLDPASTAIANDIVGAALYYTEDDDGLTRPWEGRLWLNPPYAQPACDRFVARLAREWDGGTIKAACALVNNATETGWFQQAAGRASAVCFPRGRVKFWHPDREATPLQGQAVLYLGPDPARFRENFLRFGIVVMP